MQLFRSLVNKITKRKMDIYPITENSPTKDTAKIYFKDLENENKS